MLNQVKTGAGPSMLDQIILIVLVMEAFVI